MSVFDEIDDLVDRSNTNVPQITRRQKIELYSEGLKAKIKQVEFALDSINSFAEQSDQTTSSTAPDNFLISDKIGFYCDSFWTFLYSTLPTSGSGPHRKVSSVSLQNELQLKNGQKNIHNNFQKKMTMRTSGKFNGSSRISDGHSRLSAKRSRISNGRSQPSNCLVAAQAKEARTRIGPHATFFAPSATRPWPSAAVRQSDPIR